MSWKLIEIAHGENGASFSHEQLIVIYNLVKVRENLEPVVNDILAKLQPLIAIAKHELNGENRWEGEGGACH